MLPPCRGEEIPTTFLMKTKGYNCSVEGIGSSAFEKGVGKKSPLLAADTQLSLALERHPHLFFSAQPTVQGEESVVVLLLVVVVGFGGLFSDLPCTLKMGASRDNFS